MVRKRDRSPGPSGSEVHIEIIEDNDEEDEDDDGETRRRDDDDDDDEGNDGSNVSNNASSAPIISLKRLVFHENDPPLRF
jgi:hypothetical protein